MSDHDYLLCQTCLTGYSDTKAGDPCPTKGCKGTVQVAPKFEDLVNTLPDAMTCRRRFDAYSGGLGYVHADAARQEGLDRWQQFKSNGDRVCSFCGSLHPDDFWARVKEAAEAPTDAQYGTVSSIEPSDKSYKIYVRRPGVRNAHEGGIKFYVHHFDRDEQGRAQLTEEQKTLYNTAVQASQRRMMSVYYPSAKPDPTPRH